MRLLDRILVPVDLGPNTGNVIDAAARIANAFDARVQLLYAIEEVPQFPVAVELLEQAASERLATLQNQLSGRGVICDPATTARGRPFDQIVRCATEVNAHLIVMGRGGDGKEGSLGTTTARVMRRSAKPVLVVTAGEARPLRRILCPVDSSSASARGLRTAIALAQSNSARLTVLTVIPDLPVFDKYAKPDMAKISSDYRQMERQQFEQFLRGFNFGAIAWDKEIHYGQPTDEIVGLARDARYDLIVMGSTGRSGLPRVLLGSTAETVTRRAPCSVLTVKRESMMSAQLENELSEIRQMLADAEALVEQGDYENAIGKFDQCLLKDPFLAPAIDGLAAAHERLGHFEVAADLQEQAALVRRELWPQRDSESLAIHH